MLFVAFTLYLLQGFFNADAAPLSAVSPRQTNIAPIPLQDCICPDTRTRWDIVWSCLATIFLCTWVSVHPNIPPSGEGWWKKALRRLELMFWSIIAPELIICWAAKQWVGARAISKQFSKYRWTRKHGHFMQMGGFMLYNEGKPVGVLEHDDLDQIIRKGDAVMPPITEKGIDDKSKSDGLSKALVIIQTIWFIGQCIARRTQGLILTELELITVAFAALNGIMYIFWWSKPLDVQTSVRVDLLQPSPPPMPVDPITVQNDGISLVFSPNLREISVVAHDERADTIGSSVQRETEHENVIPSLKLRTYQGIKILKFQDLCHLFWRVISGILFRWPATGISTVFFRVYSIASSHNIRPDKMGVGMFYAPNTAYLTDWGQEALFTSIPTLGVGFGAIHCAGWDFFFPSVIEANIWRVSSAIVTTVPLLFRVLLIFKFLYNQFEFAPFLPRSLANNSLGNVLVVFGVGTMLLYILARLTLLVVAFVGLRDLPPLALAAVKWTRFLPHI